VIKMPFLKLKESLMRKWFVVLALALALSIALGDAASAQVAVQAQAQAQPGVKVQAVQVQVQPAQIQVQPAQVQILPAQVQPGQGVAGPAIMPYIPGNRLAKVDAVFVGRVVALEPMDVEAAQVPGGAKVNYRIAVVQVTESIHGLKKDTKNVRVGFVMQGNNIPPVGGPGGGVKILPAQPLPPVQPGGLRRPFPGNFQPQIQLQVGQDGLFSVNKHPKEDFYLSPSFQNFVTRQNNPNFDTSVKTAKQVSKVMADPVAGLKSEDKQDRYAAAAILVNKYRMPDNPTGQALKQEPIGAAESKLILKALAEGDWAQARFGMPIPSPFELFNQLGISQQDGYNPVNLRTQQQIFEAMQKWLDDNNGKYVIKKLVVDPNAKVPPGGIRPGVIGQPGVIQPGILPAPPPPVNGPGGLVPGQQPAPQPIRRN
jgi:hypothetical protein